MTGWRVGWLVLPHDLIDSVQKLAQNLFICAPAMSQIAAEGALNDLEVLDQLRDEYRQKSDIVQAALTRVRLRPTVTTDGAFYAYVNVSVLCPSSAEFAARALDEAGVAIVPGLDFDPVNGDSYVRISFAGTTKDVEAGAQSLADWVKAQFY